jgi:hypothetical protein
MWTRSPFNCFRNLNESNASTHIIVPNSFPAAFPNGFSVRMPRIHHRPGVFAPNANCLSTSKFHEKNGQLPSIYLVASPSPFLPA